MMRRFFVLRVFSVMSVLFILTALSPISSKSWGAATDCLGRKNGDPDFGVYCDTGFDGGEGKVCVTTYIPRYFKWIWKADVPNVEKRYEVWKYGHCKEIAESEFDEKTLPEWAVPYAPDHVTPGMHTGVLTDADVISLKEKYEHKVPKRSIHSLFKNRSWECPPDQIPFNNKCYPVRFSRLRLEAKGYYMQNIWNKQYENVHLTTAPPACDPLWDIKQEISAGPGGTTIVKDVKYPKIGTVTKCMSIKLYENAAIQFVDQDFPCMLKASTSPYFKKVGNYVFDKESKLVSKMPGTKDVFRYKAGKSKFMISTSMGDRICQDMPSRFYGNPNRLDATINQFKARCTETPTQRRQCSGYDCEWPGSPSEGTSEHTCQIEDGFFSYEGTLNSTSPHVPKDRTYTCDAEPYTAARGIVYRDEITGWPKVFCPVILEKVTFCDQNNGIVVGGTDSYPFLIPAGDEPNIKCPRDKPLKVNGICTCKCPDGGMHLYDSPELCRLGGKLVEACQKPENPPYDQEAKCRSFHHHSGENLKFEELCTRKIHIPEKYKERDFLIATKIVYVGNEDSFHSFSIGPNLETTNFQEQGHLFDSLLLTSPWTRTWLQNSPVFQNVTQKQFEYLKRFTSCPMCPNSEQREVCKLHWIRGDPTLSAVFVMGPLNVAKTMSRLNNMIGNDLADELDEDYIKLSWWGRGWGQHDQGAFSPAFKGYCVELVPLVPDGYQYHTPAQNAKKTLLRIPMKAKEKKYLSLVIYALLHNRGIGFDNTTISESGSGTINNLSFWNKVHWTNLGHMGHVITTPFPVVNAYDHDRVVTMELDTSKFSRRDHIFLSIYEVETDWL